MTEEEKQAIQQQIVESSAYLAGVIQDEEKKRQEIRVLRKDECVRIAKHRISEQECIQKENQSGMEKALEYREMMKDAMKKGDAKELERLLKEII